MFVYLPQVDEPATVELLTRYSLESLHDQGASLESCTIHAHGPDGGGGKLIGWSRLGKLTAYRAATQTWHKLPAKEGRGECWLGWDNDCPPSPTTLARRKQVGSRVIKLGDGDYWLIPTVDAMPKSVGLDAAGNVTARIIDEWQTFVDETEAFMKRFRMEEAAMFVSIEEAFRYCAAALARNYRLTPELISILNLLRDEHFASIPVTALRYDLMADAA